MSEKETTQLKSDGPWHAEVTPYMWLVLLIASLGWVFDVFEGQIFVASMVAFLGFRLHWFTSLTLDTLVTVFWVVGISNAFNLLDNMDGLCAGVGCIAAVCLALL